MTFDQQLKRALDTFGDRLRDEVARQLQIVSSELATTGQAELAPEWRALEGGGATERLADGVRAIGRARSLSEVLDTLAAYAGREATRVGVLLVVGDGFRGWRWIGFGSKFEAAAHIDILRADAGVIADATRTAAAASANGQDPNAVPKFAAPLPGQPGETGQQYAAVPLVMGGQVVAVLYADGTLTSLDALDVLVRHAARCLELLTAIKAARAFTEQEPQGGTDLEEAKRTDSPAASDAGTSDDSNDEHVAARRFARLLVSEIKLYHEAQVAAGRRERDLATRLGGEIARARVLYEQRVPQEIRQDTDYFHAEVVRTLADGDPSLLEVTT